ncbi:MAG: LPS assembly protein LptD [Xenophilus sp.]
MHDPTRAARHRRTPPWPLALLTLAVLQAQGAWAQSDADAPLVLKRSPMLQDEIPRTERADRPSIIEGDKISGRPNLEAVVEGHASLRRGDTVIHADRLEYDQPDDLAKASGNVRINQAGNVYEGPQLQLKVETFEGFFDNVHYRLLNTGAHGDADRVDFLDADRAIARHATYTTCRREDYPGWMPAWFLSAVNLHTDNEENIGTAEHAQLTFMGVSSPSIPSVSFPLNNQRKSGFLPPTMGFDSVNGLLLTLPYYWNIAPNRDATFTVTPMSRRGVNLSSEFRYKEKDYEGQVRLDYMPYDTLPASRRASAIAAANTLGDYATANELETSSLSRSRWGLWAKHHQNFDASDLGLDSLTADIAINRVSDNDYWRDFDGTPTLTSRQLANDVSLNWSKGDWSGKVRTLSYQTLRYDASPILPAYNRLPQITADYAKYDWNGFDVSLDTDFTRFRGNPLEQGQPNADRVYALAQISRPFVTPGAYFTPKVQLHSVAYQYDTPLADGRTSATSTVPTVSLDSGLTFERDTSLFGRAVRQTLEPRAYYVYTPYRSGQNALPVYDTAANDFSFASLFTENEFSGHDRVSATNALTLGLSSRFLDADTGAELARFGIAQRYRFSDQDVTLPTRYGKVGRVGVTLPGTLPEAEGAGDLLLGAQVNLNSKWSLDTTLQYNLDKQTSDRRVVTARYSPSPYRTLSASYHYESDSVSSTGTGYESVDLGWQWPLNDLWGDKGKDLGTGRGQGGGRWYSIGRLNYSMRDSSLVDAVLGFEYDGCCYIGRVVLQKISTGTTTSTKRILFQIEFTGFSSLGSGSMSTLQQYVPGYQPLRGSTLAPSRFTNYDND